MSLPVRRAVVDIGTNSVKLLVAEVLGNEVRPVLEDSQQTRLGKGFYETHELQPSAIKETAKAVATFADTARDEKVATIRVIATSAARDAKNSEALLAAVLKASGLKIDIISGEREADWAFQGVTTDAKLASQHLLLLDVGGGSTEFILGHGEKKHFRQSFPLGTVRLMEKFPVSDPPSAKEFAACRDWLTEFLEKKVKPQLDPAMVQEAKMRPAGKIVLVGTGGTSTILARIEAGIDSYDRERIEATRISRAQLKKHCEQLWGMPLEERKKVLGMPAKRADVILMGVIIYDAVMEVFGFEELQVSTRGLRYAAVMQ